jgi:hypothetical protein
MNWDTVYRIGTFAALILSFYNFYLQRRDKRPRLKICLEFKKESVPSAEINEYGASVMKNADLVVIHAANPTERTIKVTSIELQPRKYSHFEVPLNRTISDIPPHDKRHAVIIIDDLRNKLSHANLTATEFRFIITDALAYKHKSKWFVLPSK